MNRTLLIALFACGLFFCAGVVASAPSESAFEQQDIDSDDVLMSVTVTEDGDAIWAIEYRTRLETEDDERAFAELKSDVENDPEPYEERFRERMDRTAASAENATGREMAISEMTVTAENRTLPQEYGVLTYRFRWSNFAAIDGDRITVGDAIDGLFLDEESSLLIAWPDGYELLDASPEPTETRSGSVVYEGPSDFAGGEPRVDLGLSGTAPDGEPNDGADANSDSDRSSPVSTPLLAALVAIVFVGVAAAFLALRRRGGTSEGGVGDRGDGEAGAETTAAPTDDELLSNEEQVLRLIESEGGRMKQQAVAERLGWTDAKTSQVTKKLRESGELDGFRLGRENVLSLPEEDPGADSNAP